MFCGLLTKMMILYGNMTYKLRLLLIVVTATLPLLVFAEETGYVPLVGNFPFLEQATSNGLEGYLNALYRIAIVFALVFSVFRLVLAGATKIMSDVATAKEKANKQIINTLIGLAIVLGATLILNTINPQLTNLGAVGSLEETNDVGTEIIETEATEAAALEQLCAPLQEVYDEAVNKGIWRSQAEINRAQKALDEAGCS